MVCRLLLATGLSKGFIAGLTSWGVLAATAGFLPEPELRYLQSSGSGKKPAVAANTPQEVKPAIKPLDKPVAKKEPTKPFVIPKTSTNKSVKYQPDFMKSVLDSPSANNQGPTQRYSDSELNEFKELIQRKLDTAKKSYHIYRV